MTNLTVAQLLKSQPLQEVEIKGWVRTFRAKRFVALNDGSTLNNIQCVVDFENFDEDTFKTNNYWSCTTCITGELVESQGKGQSVEIVV